MEELERPDPSIVVSYNASSIKGSMQPNQFSIRRTLGAAIKGYAGRPPSLFG